MEIKHVTILRRQHGVHWEAASVERITRGLRKAGLRCMACWDHRYPDIIVVTSRVPAEIVDIIPPTEIPYRIEIVDPHMSDLVKNVCYPIYGPSKSD